MDDEVAISITYWPNQQDEGPALIERHVNIFASDFVDAGNRTLAMAQIEENICQAITSGRAFLGGPGDKKTGLDS